MITVVIPTFRSYQEVRPLIDSIKETAGVPCHVLWTGANASAAKNRNLGIIYAVGIRDGEDHIFMVDDDITLQKPGWLGVMNDALLRPEVVMVSAQLYKPGGGFAYMTGLSDNHLSPREFGETEVPSKRLLTACCGFKHHGLFFDEGYNGSGFEDTDFCAQLAAKVPNGKFIVCHDAHVIHHNEQKRQREHWAENLARYENKWGPFKKGVGK